VRRKAIGAPVGSALYAGYGFVAIALAAALAPLATLLLIVPLPAVVPVPRARLSKCLERCGYRGLGSALGSVGFGAVTTFAALLFADRGWTQGWLAYTAYAVAFILARVFFSHAADRLAAPRSRCSAC
jgi:hypothetical protein